jgi:hypothetical protein
MKNADIFMLLLIVPIAYTKEYIPSLPSSLTFLWQQFTHLRQIILPYLFDELLPVHLI